MGLDPLSFWRQTPRTLHAILEGRRRAEERRHNERAWLAWHIGALGRVKKLPKLRQLLIKAGSRKPRRQTPDQMLAAAKAWHAAVHRTT